jgi:hypothetical protein
MILYGTEMGVDLKFKSVYILLAATVSSSTTKKFQGTKIQFRN